MPSISPLQPPHDDCVPQNAARVAEMLREFRTCLFSDYLPFLGQRIYDHQDGGFLWNSRYNGEVISTNKRTWYDARGVWVYARLYKQLQADPVYMERARQTLKLLKRVKQQDDPLYPWSYDRQGRSLNERPGDLYGNLFVAEACIAYSDATSQESYRDEAREMLLAAFTYQERPMYRYLMEYAPTAQPVKVQRVLGHWMIFLRLATSYLRLAPDREIEAIATRCVEELTQVHVHRDSGLMLEVHADQDDKQKDSWDDFVYLGHAIESLWMVMDEAIRLGDKDLFARTEERFKKHVEVAWDPVYGGFFHSLESIRDHRLLTDKVLWAQHEALMGCLMLWRHKACPWAAKWSYTIWSYLLAHYPLHDFPYTPWRIGGDRRLTGNPQGERIENYHHPRLLMAGIGYLEDINNNIVNLKNSNDEKRNQ